MSNASSAVTTAIAERRLALRVPLDRPIRVWSGLRRLPAQLIDLSLAGARIRCEEPLTAGHTLWFWLPAGMGGRWPHPVRGDIVWSESVSGEPTGVCHAAARFRPAFAGTLDRVFRALAEVLEPRGDRRIVERMPYERRVIARGAGGPCVLIGQDLSATGMRIDAGADLAIGSEVEIALHTGGSLPPLVVSARVVRRSGAGEAGLEFKELDAASREHLDKLLHEHPSLHGTDGRPAVVSEVVSAVAPPV